MKKVKIKLNNEMSILEILNEIERGLTDLKACSVKNDYSMWMETGALMCDRKQICEKGTITIENLKF